MNLEVVEEVMKNMRALLQVGESLGPLEGAAAYLLPLLYLLSPLTDLKEIMLFNGICQMVLFLFIVQIPLAVTGKMAYVDIGYENPCFDILKAMMFDCMSDGHAVSSFLDIMD